MKTPAKNFKGILYIQLIELPVDQQELLVKTIHKDLFIKILIGEKILSNCLQYVDYELWYNNVYSINRDAQTPANVVEQPGVLANH